MKSGSTTVSELINVEEWREPWGVNVRKAGSYTPGHETSSLSYVKSRPKSFSLGPTTIYSHITVTLSREGQENMRKEVMIHTITELPRCWCKEKSQDRGVLESPALLDQGLDGRFRPQDSPWVDSEGESPAIDLRLERQALNPWARIVHIDLLSDMIDVLMKVEINLTLCKSWISTKLPLCIESTIMLFWDWLRGWKCSLQPNTWSEPIYIASESLWDISDKSQKLT